MYVTVESAGRSAAAFDSVECLADNYRARLPPEVQSGNRTRCPRFRFWPFGHDVDGEENDGFRS